MADLVPSLLRTVVRDFYDTRAVIVLDAVLVHHVLSDRELMSATGIGIKDVRATCARLREDHLLQEVSHRDESGIRAYTHTVYYIHFTEAVDAIKWKMHLVENKLREELNHQHNAQDYVCDTCGKHYEPIDALSLFDPESQQFLCEICSSPLRENDPQVEKAEKTADEGSEMEEFMLQLQPVLEMLKQIDEITVPENTFESELQKHVPLIGIENSGPQSYNLPAHLGGSIVANAGKSGAESGITIAGSSNSRLPQQIESTFQINITSEAEQASQQEAALREKQRLAEENALPEWHSQSTVSTSIGSTVPKVEAGQTPPIAEPHQPESAEPTNTNASSAESAMDAYFQQLQAEQGNDDDEAEDDDEFEDVV